MNKPTFQAMAAQYEVKETTGEGLVQWEQGAHCVVPSVVIGGKAVQDGTPTPENPIEPVFSSGTKVRVTNDAGFDGGEAAVPELLAIPGTEYRDEWDAQTGRGVKRIHKIEFDGSEPWGDAELSSYGIMIIPVVAMGHPNVNGRNSGFCNYGGPVGRSNPDGAALALGLPETPFNNHWGIDNVSDWKKYLAARYSEGTPVTVWYPMGEPVPFQTDPQPLIQPKGECNLIQTGGTLEDCPITAKYVTHSKGGAE